MSKIIHRDKFLNGRMTPEELHREMAFPIGSTCRGCGRPPTIAIRSFAEEAEMFSRDPNLMVLAKTDPDTYGKMLVKTKAGRFIKLGEIYSCPTCAPEAEKAAAKHPSWCFVEVDRGPGPDRIMMGAGGR